MSHLLIVGASVRAAAESAARGGFSVLAADMFADHDTRAIADCIRVADYPTEFRNIRDAHPGTPIMYTGAIENHIELIEWFTRSGPLWGNPAGIVRRVRDPFELQSVLARNDIPFPTTTTCGQLDADSGPWLRKRESSAGGQHVSGSTALTEPATYYQACLEGDVCSAAYVANGERAQLLGVSDMLVGCPWLGATGFMYCGSTIRHAGKPELLQWMKIGHTIANEFGLIGLFGVDAIFQDQTVVPIEVNPRYTASMELYERSNEVSVVELHADAFRSTSLMPVNMPSIAIGKAIVYATKSVSISSPPEPPSADVVLADLPTEGEIRERHPVLTIIVRSENHHDLVPRLKSAAQAIYSQL